jgi:hypothetical protein
VDIDEEEDDDDDDDDDDDVDVALSFCFSFSLFAIFVGLDSSRVYGKRINPSLTERDGTNDERIDDALI